MEKKEMPKVDHRAIWQKMNDLSLENQKNLKRRHYITKKIKEYEQELIKLIDESLEISNNYSKIQKKYYGE